MKIFHVPQLIVGLLTAVVVALVTNSMAQAFLINYRWASNNAPFRYDLSLPTNFQSGTNYGANVWTDVTTSSWYWIINAPTSPNDIRYGAIDGPGNIAGIVQPYTCGGWLCQFYLKYDGAESWYIGSGTPGAGQIDLRSIAAHEFGHAAGLGHTQAAYCPGNASNATMCSGYVPGTTYLRTLEADDRAGLFTAYP